MVGGQEEEVEEEGEEEGGEGGGGAFFSWSRGMLMRILACGNACPRDSRREVKPYAPKPNPYGSSTLPCKERGGSLAILGEDGTSYHPVKREAGVIHDRC